METQFALHQAIADQGYPHWLDEKVGVVEVLQVHGRGQEESAACVDDEGGTSDREGRHGRGEAPVGMGGRGEGRHGHEEETCAGRQEEVVGTLPVA